MKKKDALKIPELLIDVTPAVEDAFHFLYPIEEDATPTDAALHAGERLTQSPDTLGAVNVAYQMIDNIRKYGVACAEWCED